MTYFCEYLFNYINGGIMPESKNLESISLADKNIRTDALAEALRIIRVEDFETVTNFLKNIPLISLNEAWAIIHDLDHKVIEVDRNDVLRATQNTLCIHQKSI